MVLQVTQDTDVPSIRDAEGALREANRPNYPNGFNWITPIQMESPTNLATAVAVYETKAKPILDLLDDCTTERVETMSVALIEVHPELHAHFVKAAEADTQVRAECQAKAETRPIYVCHQADRVLDKEVFNPALHVREQDIVLLSSTGEYSSGRGWELARVSKIYELQGEKFIDVVYVLPYGASKTVTRSGKHLGKCRSWGCYDNWVKQRLVPWPLGPGRLWGDNCISLDAVWWGCTPTKGKTIRTKSRDDKILRAQILRVEAAWRVLRRSPTTSSDEPAMPLPPTNRTSATDPLPTSGTQVDDDDDADDLMSWGR